MNTDGPGGSGEEETSMSCAPRRTLAAFVAVVAASSQLWLTPAEATTPQETYQNQARAATNTVRVAAGLARVKKQDCVQRFAVRQAVRMARQERMFHQDLGPILEQCHLSTTGENVAYGYASGLAVVNLGWMLSPGHRANILNPRYRLMGLAARKADNGQWYAAQVFGRGA
jgi:uncharacterized protein YkwD